MTQQELELPKGWAETSLDSLSFLITKGSTPTTYGYDYLEKGINFVKVENIINGQIDKNSIKEFISKDTNDFLKRSQLKENDILFSIAGTIGRTTIVRKEDLPANTNQAIALIRYPWQYLEPTFIKTILDSPILFNSFSKNRRGSGMDNVSLGDIKQIIFPLPPLNEQKRIVSKIEELFSKIDSTKQSLEHTKLRLELYRQSLLNAAVSGTIFGNEEKYDQIPLSDVIDSIGQGWSPKCEKIPSLNDEDWAVITTTAIQPMKFDDKQNKKLPQNLEPKLKLELEEDDLLITRAGPRSRVGITCLIKKIRRRLLLCDKAYRIRFKKTLVNPKFFEIVLNSPKIVTEINGIKTGTSDSGLNITMKRFSNLIIPLPSIKQQEEIIAKIEQGFTLIENSQRIVNSTLQTLETMRMSVLKQAFEGKLVPQDPNDEPASILLEKIKNAQVDLKPKQGRAKNVK